jgi:CheY-like chemotaxis protein
VDGKKIDKISNPLTMIGVFAGLAEIAGVIVLPTLSESLQKYFIWYVMGFPILLVSLFFYVLIRYPLALYAPSDFRNEKIYERLWLERNFKSIKKDLEKADSNKKPNRSSSSNMADEDLADIVVRAFSNLENKLFRWTNRILWVDDKPESNVYERKALEKIGYEFTTVVSTAQALDLLSKEKFAVIISDMGRQDDLQAGYGLLAAIRERGISTPFFIYSGSDSVEYREEARRRGAQGSTRYAYELLSMIVGNNSLLI